jgi:beta-lactamase class D
MYNLMIKYFEQMKYSLLFIILITLISCNRGNITIEDGLKKHFDKYNVTGCFGMFDNGHGQFTLYNYNHYKDSMFLPASTFKMVNALIAVETGIVLNDTTMLKWDGVTRSNIDWNSDLTLHKAFEVSSIPHFQALARQIGSQRMLKYLDSLKFTDTKMFHLDTTLLRKNLDSFWLNNTFKVIPDEMLGFVKKLYFNQLPGFQPRTHKVVQNMMVREKTDKYILAYKTGWGQDPQGRQVGWITGWIEENKHPYFFVINLLSNNVSIDYKKIRIELLKDILKEKGFFEGKK